MPDRLTELEARLRTLVTQEAFAEARLALEQYSAELDHWLRAPAADADPTRLLTGALDLFIWVRFSTLVSRQHTSAALTRLESLSRYSVPPESATLVDVSSV